MFTGQRSVVRAIAVGLGALADIADDLLGAADVVTRAIHYRRFPTEQRPRRYASIRGSDLLGRTVWEIREATP